MSRTFIKELQKKGRVRFCLELINSEELKGKTVIDIGSSFGWLEKELLGSGAKLVGIEPNNEAVKFASTHVKGAEFKVGNALDIPIKDKTADIVILFDVIEHVPVGTENKVLAEIKRVLKRKGVLLLTTPNSHWLANILDPAWYLGHRHYSSSKLKELFEKSNFEIEEHYIRGGVFSVLYMAWFYIAKWVLRSDTFVWMKELDDSSYNSPRGFVTHYIKSRSI